MNVFDMHDAAQRLEPLERSKRLLDGVGGEQSRRLHFPSEAAQRLLVEDGREVARPVLIDDEADGIRSDVDDRDLARTRTMRGLALARAAACRRLRRGIDAPNGA